MIIGEKFVWLHFPKCAGTFTERLIKQYISKEQEIRFDNIDPENIIWHQNIIQRERLTGEKLTNKDIICNFRRLPSWIISRTQYEKKMSGKNTPKELYIRGLFYEGDGTITSADTYLEIYTSCKIDHWIRIENIEYDFFKHFAKYLSLKKEIYQYDFKQKYNTSEWDGNIDSFFNNKELELLYNSCPKWADLELQLYGNILV